MESPTNGCIVDSVCQGASTDGVRFQLYYIVELHWDSAK